MIPVRTALAAIGASAVLGVLAAPAVGAGIWTPIDSGLGAGATDIIRAIDYQSDARFWYATSGKIRYREGGVFKAATGSFSTVVFNDIAFKPGSDIGIAVGNNGHLWRSTDAGKTWARVTFSAYAQVCGDESDNGGHLSMTTNPPVDLLSVTWGLGTRAWIGTTGTGASGYDGLLLRSNDNGATWTDINKSVGPEPGWPTYEQVFCKVNRAIDDVAPITQEATTPDNMVELYFISRDGNVFYTSDGLSSAPWQRSYLGWGSGRNMLVLDPVNPTRQWVVTAGYAGLFAYTEDDHTVQYPEVVNDLSGTRGANQAIAAAGSAPTIVAAGGSGDVLTSIDGRHFYSQRADGTLATKDWYSVDGYDAGHFAIGGAGGSLAVTTQADHIVDVIAPTGEISGPTDVYVGDTATYTVAASDDAGGSGIDDASYVWKVDGVTVGTGPSLSYVFPADDVYDVSVAFKDVAGNAGSDDLYVDAWDRPAPPPPETTTTVTTPPPVTTTTTTTTTAPPVVTPSSLPQPVLASATTPPVLGSGAVKKGGYVTIRVKGKIKLPKGVPASKGYTGKVGLSVLLGRKLLTYREAKISSTGWYSKTIRIGASKVGAAKTVKLRVKFLGNKVMTAVEKTYTVKVKKG